MARSTPKTPLGKRSLVDFVMAKKREGCPVCALPPEVREQVASASVKKIHRAAVLDWLKAEYGITLTAALFDQHHSGRHER